MTALGGVGANGLTHTPRDVAGVVGVEGAPRHVTGLAALLPATDPGGRQQCHLRSSYCRWGFHMRDAPRTSLAPFTNCAL